jgi:tRNA-splicing ligase RtcB
MTVEKIDVVKVEDYIYEIPKTGEMVVPGRIYGDEDIIRHLLHDIELGKEWNALKQIKNVACLPGIQKYSLAMADIHPGYGYPIGGIGAFELENGVISVAGVGFDINCLPRDSNVLTSLGYYKPIQAFETDFTEVGSTHGKYELLSQAGRQSLVSYDSEKKGFYPGNALLFMKRKHSGELLRVETRLGYVIRATAEHPILTDIGMARSDRLEKGRKIAIYPFRGVKYEPVTEDMVLADEKVFSKPEQEELKERGLLPLRLSNPQLGVIARLFGYLLGDGNIYVSQKKGRICAYGQEEDLKEIQADFEALGFSARIYSRRREHKIPTRYGKVEFTATTHELHVGSNSLTKLFFELGYPLGEKTIAYCVVPRWIMGSPLWMKRLFLSGFFGAELSKPRTHTKTGFDCPTVSINKNHSVVENGRKFAIQLMSLLEELGVESHKLLQREDYFNKHGPTDRLKLQISSKETNLKRLWSTIGFSYNHKREQLGQIALLYIKEKALMTSRRLEVSAKVKELKQKGLSLREVQGLLESPLCNKRFIERHYYEQAGQRLVLDFPSFGDYVNARSKEISEKGCLFDEIVSITREDYEGYVYDFNVPDSHSFVAEGVVVSNCGVRTMKSKLTRADVLKVQKELAESLFRTVPAGIGSKGDVALKEKEIDELLVEGAEFVVNRDYGFKKDLEYIEECGTVKGADPANVSLRSKQREYRQIGTLGSGNHYLEVQYVEKVFDEAAAKAYGLFEDQILISIHCGSRALGHQIGTDYLQTLEMASKKYGIPIRDKELVCAPINSPEGQRYFSAVNAGINCAFANRQAIAHLTRKAFKFMGVAPEEIETFYDIGHNNVKLERHIVDGKLRELLVHRKGSTRAFGPDRDEVPKAYRKIGQPVLVGGTMGTASYILHGTQKGMEDTFGSAIHGAAGGVRGEHVINELAKQGIIIKGHSMAGIAEEAPSAYKEVEQVVDVMHNSGVAKKVVRVRPLISIKG